MFLDHYAKRLLCYVNFFSFLFRKIKKPQPIVNENKENNAYDFSLSVVSPITHDKNLTNDKIHVDVTQNSYDKSMILYDSNEASPRDLSSSSQPYKVSKSSI